MLLFEDVSRSPWVLCHSCMIPLMFVQEIWIGEENNRNKRLSIAVKRLVWQQGETECVKRRKWLFMHTWRYNHLMMRTTNPIESCMSSLCRRMSGLGCAREANLFNHYRILVTWMILRMKKRGWVGAKRWCLWSRVENPWNMDCETSDNESTPCAML